MCSPVFTSQDFNDELIRSMAIPSDAMKDGLVLWFLEGQQSQTEFFFPCSHSCQVLMYMWNTLWWSIEDLKGWTPARVCSRVCQCLLNPWPQKFTECLCFQRAFTWLNPWHQRFREHIEGSLKCYMWLWVWLQCFTMHPAKNCELWRASKCHKGTTGSSIWTRRGLHSGRTDSCCNWPWLRYFILAFFLFGNWKINASEIMFYCEFQL